MSRRVITDANAPNPIGAYNQAVIANGFIFTAGQIAIDPATGKLIEESFKARVHQVFKNHCHQHQYQTDHTEHVQCVLEIPALTGKNTEA